MDSNSIVVSTMEAQMEEHSSSSNHAFDDLESETHLGLDNVAFQYDTTVHLSPPGNSLEEQSRRSISIIDDHENDEEERQQETKINISQVRAKTGRKLKWKMSLYFYIHLVIFFINALIGGLFVYLIENHTGFRNRNMEVTYIDAWFVCATCVFSCGLTTLDFAQLSIPSQSVLMFYTLISGITVSTLPALAVKAYTHRNAEGARVIDDQGRIDENPQEDLDDDELPTVNIKRQKKLPEDIRRQLASLPTPRQLRYRAYILCFLVIIGTCAFINVTGFVAVGAWLDKQYTPEQLTQGNRTLNAWYISFIVVLTGFNQNGMTPFSNGFSRFIYDAYLNIFVMLIVVFGTSLFPYLLRNVIILTRKLVPWRHKVIFDYILTNNHRLCTLLFPAVQTRIYLIVTLILTILSVVISLILDFNREPFTGYNPGTRVLIFFFHTINSRFAGFQTVDMNSFALATLLVYLLLMATKPQMLCSLDESPLELAWLALHAEKEAKAQAATNDQSPSSAVAVATRDRSDSVGSASVDANLPMRHMKRFLRRQSLVTKDLVREQLAIPPMTHPNPKKSQNLSSLRTRLFLIHFTRALLKNTASLLFITRTWLFFFIFLICAIEYRRMTPVDPEITFFKVVFEIISAFGTTGYSLGYPNVSSSFSTVLSPTSKVIVLLTMFMGRHRGLLDSMKDQEAIEFSAAQLLQRARDQLISDYERKQAAKLLKQREQVNDEVADERF